MKKLIINADDCGMNVVVNEHIEQAILGGKITSTTVMANMDDFEGAVALCKKYGNRISFGWHINLTEAQPLLKSDLLLDSGYYVETDGRISFNGKAFWSKRLKKDMRSEIRKELLAQYEKLHDNGIVPSHADSHHHIHTSKGLMLMIPSLLDELDIRKMRRLRNYVPLSANYFTRQLVGGVISVLHPRIKMADTFCSFGEFRPESSIPCGQTIELECHPGHPKFVEEEQLLMASQMGEKFELISYNSL